MDLSCVPVRWLRPARPYQMRFPFSSDRTVIDCGRLLVTNLHPSTAAALGHRPASPPSRIPISSSAVESIRSGVISPDITSTLPARSPACRGDAAWPRCAVGRHRSGCRGAAGPPRVTEWKTGPTDAGLSGWFFVPGGRRRAVNRKLLCIIVKDTLPGQAGQGQAVALAYLPARTRGLSAVRLYTQPPPRRDQSAHSSAAHSISRSSRSSIDLDLQPAVSMMSATSPAIRSPVLR